VSISEYLACLSVKYGVEPDKLFGALVLASENRESTCGGLSITCRSKLRDRTVLLITNGPKVVAQFPVSRRFFFERKNPIEISKRTDVLRAHLQREIKAPRPLNICDSRTGMKQVNLKAKVLEITKPTLVFTRYGTYAKVANALVSDETGTIKLCLWNEQVNLISVGDVLQIENANVSTFRGERQLRIGKHGTLRIMKDAVSFEETHEPANVVNRYSYEVTT
jgi:replication factor A1